MKRHNLFKIFIVFSTITLPVAGYFAWPALSGTVINQSINTIDLTSGLVGHWTFDGSDLTQNAVNRGGEQEPGYLTNFTSTTTKPGRISQGLEFDGSDDVVKVPGDDTPVSFSTGRVSVAAWIYPTAAGQSGDSHIAGKFLDNDGCGDFRYAWGIAFQSDNEASFRVSSNAGGDNTGPDSISTLPLNQWSHVTGTYDRSRIRIYINGVEDNSTAFTPAVAGGEGCDFAVGAHPDAPANTRFEGRIDDVRVWDRALSAEEVRRLYELGATTKINQSVNTLDLTSGLVGHWTFDGKNLIDNAADSSGQGNTGYLTNFTSTTTARGRIGQALDFDGTNDYVLSSYEPNMAAGDNFTVSAWVKETYLSSAADEANIIAASENTAGQPSLRFGFEFGAPCSTVGMIVFAVQDNDSIAEDSVCSSKAYNDGAWKLVTAVFNDDANTMGLYINGELDASAAITANSTGAKNWSGIPWPFGARRDDVGDTEEFLDALIDDVRVYNRALSAEEVNRLYQLGR